MKLSIFSFVALLLPLLLLSPENKATKVKGSDKDLVQLVNLLIGDFDSEAQSKRDTDYYHISLHMRAIWPKHTNDKVYWLYIEQAMGSKQDKPYRQRVYKVERVEDNLFKSSVYTLPDEKNWVNKWKTTSDFDAITPENLVLRDGCAVWLSKKGKKLFAGATRENACESTLRGAAYAKSTVTVNKKMLLSWDQGFDTKGDQVWGATKGGYEFIRKG